jgi:hypothetical protein
MISVGTSRLRIVLILIGLLPAVILLCPFAANAGWRIDVVDMTRYFQSCSARFDAGGGLHVAYGGDHLYYAFSSGGPWQYRIPDGERQVGAHCSLALDSSGNPGFSYVDGLVEDIRFARWTGSRWVVEVVDTEGITESATSVAFDALDRPVIAYRAAGLEVAWRNGAGWNISTLESDVSYDGISIAVDPAGNPAVAYKCYTPGYQLRYAKWNGAAWDFQTVCSLDHDSGSFSIAFDSFGNPGISFQDTDFNEVLRFARWDGVSWTVDTLDSDGRAGFYSSLAFDASGNPAIAYRQSPGSGSTLRLARWDGTAWNITTLDSGDIGCTSLAIDPAGAPAVVYCDTETNFLKLLRWNGASWDTTTVDRSSGGFKYTSLALDSAGRPVFTYNGIGPRLARWDGSSWNIEIVSTANDSEFASLALDSSGYPAVSYCQYDDRDLNFARWDGSAWNIETIESDGETGFSTSLELDAAGYPAISYIDWTDARLKLARWDGSRWNFWIVDCVDVCGASPKLALDSLDQPVIGYGCGGHLKLARWNGVLWDIQTVDASGEVGSLIGMALDSSDFPFISYMDARDISNTVVYLKMARWDGTAWELETVDTITNLFVGNGSLVLDASGYPILAYYDFGLKLARWDGSAWNFEIVDSTAKAGGYASIVLNGDGDPVISYEDNTYEKEGVKLARILRAPIYRGDSPSGLSEVARGELPWTDPDPVLTGSFPALLYYSVDEISPIFLRKESQTITILY